ncbi:NAD(P)/FAD-dependent oxidoreductase [Mesorhizobium sp. SB112]|uniref:NAD(P)/FAD-dependent oxidoreductase n=1 Tax=Mesorhizobium sp. SB112 TaxID=3151853 RepID=UPI003266A7F9
MTITFHAKPPRTRLKIAVVGSGISGLSAAWLLSRSHQVSVFESDDRIGGHSNTVEVDGTPVDTGFIVYNELTYPNLTALFKHLDVPTKPSDMSFAVSLDDGAFEYSGSISGLVAQRRNLVRPSYWSMMRDLTRFYRTAPLDAPGLGLTTLEEYLDAKNYGASFRRDHLYPMAAAIWSTPANDISQFPARAFIRFFDNHGLLNFGNRPTWRTVDGGSREYVKRLTETFTDNVFRKRAVKAIHRPGRNVIVEDSTGRLEEFDHVVIATHADHALAMLDQPTAEEKNLLGAFHYIENEAVLHSDPSVMPKRKSVWSSWNYSARRKGPSCKDLSVTYWMNRLQGIPDNKPMFMTLNTIRKPDPKLVHHSQSYSHPMYNAKAIAAQDELWSLQGVRNTWFCGSYFGAGFHEDGLQSGLAVAEELGGDRRPWNVAEESGRISLRRIAQNTDFESGWHEQDRILAV